MIKQLSPIKGEIKEKKMIDMRGVRFDPFNLDSNTPMFNPITLKLTNKWEDGVYLFDDLFHGMDKQSLMIVNNNEIIEFYNLEKVK